MLQPHLSDWIGEASTAGCETGVLTNGMLLTKRITSRLLEAGVDWVCISLDGATDDVYQAIRVGADYHKVCDNISNLTALRQGAHPKVMINFVLLEANIHQASDIIRLAAELGVDQVNFKHCDVIRGEFGRGLGLYTSEVTRKTRKWKKEIRKALRLAGRMDIIATTYGWTPQELPVCAQNPRTGIFIRHDGAAAPCINLAMGGPTRFLGKPVDMPTVHYGNITMHSLDRLWETSACRFFRNRFSERVAIYETALSRIGEISSLIKLEEALNEAAETMPRAPEGCRICHYLYNI